MSDSDSSESSAPRLVVEATVPYRWDPATNTVIQVDPDREGSEWTVVARDPVSNWSRIVTSIFAIRQLQQWFNATGEGLKKVNPALRDKIAKTWRR